MEIARYVGWVTTLALVMLIVSHMTMGLLSHLKKQSLAGEVVESDEASDAFFRGFNRTYAFAVKRWLATVCSVAVLLTLLCEGVDYYPALGFAGITFVISAVLTPAIIRSVIRPLVVTSVLRLTMIRSSHKD